MTSQTQFAVAAIKGNRTSSALFLRIASLLSLLHCVGHTIGAVFGIDAPAGTTEGKVIDAMKSNHFDVMGASRSFWDFFFGFGLNISVGELVQAVLFWQLAGLAKIDPRRLRPIIASFFLANIAYAILAWRYIFVPPFVGAVLTAIALGLAYLRAGVAPSKVEHS
jgi:hypothetical protein